MIKCDEAAEHCPLLPGPLLQQLKDWEWTKKIIYVCVCVWGGGRGVVAVNARDSSLHLGA